MNFIEVRYKLTMNCEILYLHYTDELYLLYKSKYDRQARCKLAIAYKYFKIIRSIQFKNII